MNDVPERLTLELRQGMAADFWSECRDPRYAKSQAVEYVRADVASATIKDLRAEVKKWQNEWGIERARADAAEAEVARLTAERDVIAQRFDELHPDPALMARIIIASIENEQRAFTAEAELAALKGVNDGNP